MLWSQLKPGTFLYRSDSSAISYYYIREVHPQEIVTTHIVYRIGGLKMETETISKHSWITLNIGQAAKESLFKDLNKYIIIRTAFDKG